MLPYYIYINPIVRDIRIPSLNGPFFRIPDVVKTDGGAAGMDMLSAMGTFWRAYLSPVGRQTSDTQNLRSGQIPTGFNQDGVHDATND